MVIFLSVRIIKTPEDEDNLKRRERKVGPLFVSYILSSANHDVEEQIYQATRAAGPIEIGYGEEV
jgi:hypothetical protein